MYEKVTRSLSTFKSKWNFTYEISRFLITQFFMTYLIIFLKVFYTEKNAKYLSTLILEWNKYSITFQEIKERETLFHEIFPHVFQHIFARLNILYNLTAFLYS